MGKEFSFHRICLSCIFLFGNIALFVPYKNAKNGELSAILTALAIGILLYAAAYYSVGFLKNKNLSKPVSDIFCIIAIVLCLAANSVTTKNFINYISSDVLIKNLKILILFSFFLICIYIVSKKNEVTAKLAFLSFVFIILTITVLFFVSGKNFEPVNLKELFCGKIIKRSIFYLFKAFVFPVVYAIFSVFAFKEKDIKKDILGNAIGGALIVVCFFSAALTFTLPFASDIDFAYPMSISVVNIGELFTRMDGFAYFIFFLSALIKASVCGLAVKMLLQKMGVKKASGITVLLQSLSFSVSYLL